MITDVRKHYDIVLTYGDLHLPTTNTKLQDNLLQIISDIQPTGIIDGGDIINSDSLSTFPKTHDQLAGLQFDLDEGEKWMWRVNAASNKSWKVLLKDNHFIRRLENKKKGQYWMHELNALNAEQLLGCDKTGWQLLNEYKWKDTILFLHGDDNAYNTISRNPVNKVRNMVKDVGISIVRYHSHTSGIEILKQHGQDRLAIQIGTFQDAKKANYIKHAATINWTTSAGIFYLSKKTDEFVYTPILFVNGKTVVNGIIYD